jgi:hypothetical protein
MAADMKSVSVTQGLQLMPGVPHFLDLLSVYIASIEIRAAALISSSHGNQRVDPIPVESICSHLDEIVPEPVSAIA